MAQTITTKFAAQLANLRRESRAYVVNTVKGVTVFDDTNLISFKINNNLQKENQIFGNTISKYATLVLQNPTNSTYSWIGDTVELYTGLTIDMDTLPFVEYLKQGTFTVVAEKKDTVNESISLELYDNMTKLNISYTGSNAFPQTMASFATELCVSAGLVLGSTTFTNSTKVLTTVPNVESGENTLRDMLGWLCELAVGNAVIGNDGKVYIKNYGTTSIFTITPDLYNELDVGSEFGPLDSVIYQFMPQNDIVFAPDPLPVNYNAFVITNNPVAYNQRADVVTTIQAQINNFRYYPFAVKWRGTGHLEFMDKITVENLDGSTYSSYIMNSLLEFDGALNEELNAVAYTVQQSEVKYGNSGKEWRRQTSLTVDKINQEINAIVSSIEGTGGLESRMDAAELKITPTAITTTVEKNTTLLASKTLVSQTADSTKIAAEQQIRSEYGDTISNIETNFIFDTSGLTISKSDSDFAVKITNSEMGFYDGPTKTAYVSGGEFYINKGNVVSSLTVGVHKQEKYSNGITIFRFVG